MRMTWCAVGVAVIFGLPAGGGVAAAAKCTPAQTKAAGKRLLAEAGCHAKALAGGGPVDAACLQKAETKFRVAFAKAEGKGGCALPGSVEAVDQAIETCTTAVMARIRPLCGDTILGGDEECDDGNTTSGDGCSAACSSEIVCGDGVLAGSEDCDDGNTLPGDGCDDVCIPEAGFDCNGSPSVCTTLCGDGLIVGVEDCDDGNTAAGDGCAADCFTELGFICAGTPSACSTTCGDGLPAGAEQCDDGNGIDGDGCNATCTSEAGFYCTGSPSVCATVCGDGQLAGTESCDDGNTVNGDGCDATCQIE